MNEWVRKNRTKFYAMLHQLEQHHLRGGYGGDLNLSDVYIMLSELYKEVDSTQVDKELAVADLAVARSKIKELKSELGKLGNMVAQKE